MLKKEVKRSTRTRPPRQRPWQRQAETGQVMLIVVAMIALISSVPIVVLSRAVSQLSLTNENLYWNGAYEAAEAGLNDYTQQLDASSGFAQWVNTNSSFSCTYSPPALPTDSAGDPAFCG